MTPIFRRLESEVRSYCRSFPAVFDSAHGSRIRTRDGKEYIDFFAGAGALNYGHNHPHLKSALLEWIERDGITHSLDLMTVAKEKFLQAFQEAVLFPRTLDHRVMFTGPTGTNAVEAALKTARKATGRSSIVAFTNGFHGMTLGALAVTGNRYNRNAAGVPLTNVSRVPYDGYNGAGPRQSLELLEVLLEDNSSGMPRPAGILLETVQAEGGVNPCSIEWLQGVAALAEHHSIPLIVDDIQVGCGRTGPFFSFEEAGIVPDIVCLSKSLSGYGLPFAVVLIRPELDQWQPGEHNGTFRGHNPAFVTATAALDFWRTNEFRGGIDERSQIVTERFDRIADASGAVDRRGRGMIQAIEWADPETAGRVSEAAFERGLIVETAGAKGQVIKFLGALNIPLDDLNGGLDILEESVEMVTTPRLRTASA